MVDTEGRLVPAASYRLFTWMAGGTTVPQTTYEDQAGASPNENPITLDAEGRCNLWLDPALEYCIELREPVAMGGATVWIRDDVVGSAETTNTVLSVNGLTGDVTLTADDIEFTSSSGLDWLDATDAGAAIDQVAARANAPEAETVTLEDAGGYFPSADNVEEALQLVGEALGDATPGRFLRSLAFTASAIWAVPEDVGSILVRMVGGGGGGASGAGGGGGGGFCERHIVAPTTPINITVGAGGIAGANGGDTIFGTYMTAGGGLAGSTAGGEGGTCTGGDINLKGGGGGGRAEDAGGNGGFGTGGNSYFGGGARGTPYPGGGAAGGTNTGGGGSGGQGGGGAGGSGLVMVYQYT